jgi:carotenoid cleavage dioxygenase-like enzyme
MPVNRESTSRDGQVNTFPAPFPSSIGFLSRKECVLLSLQVLDGSIPPDLYGSVFFIGPGGFVDSSVDERTGFVHPSQDGTPLFNGDPLLYRLDFTINDQTGDPAIALTSKIPRTPCYFTDIACAANERWKKYRYTNYGLARLSFQLGFRNEINTAVIPLHFGEADGNRLLLTWDAGRPFEIDPVSLDVVTAVGYNEEWKEQINLKLPFGIVTTPAHPAFAPSGQQQTSGCSLFTLNYGKSIGTTLHPIINGYVDAPFKNKDKELVKTINDFLSFTENCLTIINAILPRLKVIERVVPKALTAIGKGLTHQIFDITANLVLDRSNQTLSLSFRNILAELIGLLKEFVKKGVAPSESLPSKTLKESLGELARLIGVLRSVIVNAEAMEDFVHLISWDGEKPLQTWKIVAEGENSSPRIMQSMHQLGVTEDYVILMDTVFKLGAEQLLTSPAPNFPELERMIRKLLDYRQSDRTVIYIVKRKDLTSNTKDPVTAKRVDIQRSTAHFQVNYLNPDHKITLHCAHNTGWDAAEWVREYDQFTDSPLKGIVGMSSGGTDISVLGKYIIDAENGLVLEESIAEDRSGSLSWMLSICTTCQPDGVTPPDEIHDIFWNGWGSHCDLLPDYIKTVNSAAMPRCYSIKEASKIAAKGLSPTIIRLDTSSMSIKDSYIFPPGFFGNSVQFVPRSSAESGCAEGHLICVVNSNSHPETSEFWLFDAQSLSSGPICKVGHPDLKIGMTIHTAWVPGIAQRTATYRVDARKDYEERIKLSGDEEIQLLFEDSVYPHFEEV